MEKMSDIEKILSMGIGRSGLGFEAESRVVAETIKELQAYQAIGTLEECREALQKMKGE